MHELVANSFTRLKRPPQSHPTLSGRHFEIFETRSRDSSAAMGLAKSSESAVLFFLNLVDIVRVSPIFLQPEVFPERIFLTARRPDHPRLHGLPRDRAWDQGSSRIPVLHTHWNRLLHYYRGASELIGQGLFEPRRVVRGTAQRLSFRQQSLSPETTNIFSIFTIPIQLPFCYKKAKKKSVFLLFPQSRWLGMILMLACFASCVFLFVKPEMVEDKVKEVDMAAEEKKELINILEKYTKIIAAVFGGMGFLQVSQYPLSFLIFFHRAQHFAIPARPLHHVVNVGHGVQERSHSQEGLRRAIPLFFLPVHHFHFV